MALSERGLDANLEAFCRYQLEVYHVLKLWLDDRPVFSSHVEEYPLRSCIFEILDYDMLIVPLGRRLPAAHADEDLETGWHRLVIGQQQA